MLTKSQLRTKILDILRNHKEEDRSRKSNAIKERLFKTPVFRNAKNVMFYISFDGEVDTEKMIKHARMLGKMIMVPVCSRNGGIIPCLLNDNVKLVRDLYGTRVPAVKCASGCKAIDLVVVPGVAFDRRGNRLGRGKGYYDRFLRKLPDKTTSIGLAFDFQILPKVPTTERDVSVKRVIFA
jgi:5-formyltetrahydrofolate cyclo-ligase